MTGYDTGFISTSIRPGTVQGCPVCGVSNSDKSGNSVSNPDTQTTRYLDDLKPLTVEWQRGKVH